eukprot:363761-Chlamydomonas_euryale.AAC.34
MPVRRRRSGCSSLESPQLKQVRIGKVGSECPFQESPPSPLHPQVTQHACTCARTCAGVGAGARPAALAHRPRVAVNSIRCDVARAAAGAARAVCVRAGLRCVLLPRTRPMVRDWRRGDQGRALTTRGMGLREGATQGGRLRLVVRDGGGR